MIATKSQNFNWINNLRIIALLAVIILHTTAPLLSQYGKVPLSNWLQADFYNGLVRFAVPVFVMITGTLLLHREYELGEFLKRRLGRVVVPFLFWSLVYVGYSWYNEEISFDADTWTNIKLILHLLKYGSSYHLWYVYMLIGLYFFIPVLGKFVRNASEKEIVYFLIVWLVVMMLSQPYISRFNPQIDLHYFAGYAGYLVLGHYLAFKEFSNRHLLKWVVILFIAVLAIIVFGTFLLYKYNTGLITLLYEPVGPSIVLLASGVFLMGRFSMPKVPLVINRIRDFASPYNYGIYLSHALVLYLLDLLGMSYKMCMPLVSIPVTAITCFILSLLLTWLISKLPLGKWISG